MIWTLAFWKGAGERALKTFAQAFLAAVGVNAGMTLGQVSWAQDASIAAVATILSLFTSLGNASFTAGAVAQENAAALLTKNLGGTQPSLELVGGIGGVHPDGTVDATFIAPAVLDSTQAVAPAPAVVPDLAPTVAPAAPPTQA